MFLLLPNFSPIDAKDVIKSLYALMYSAVWSGAVGTGGGNGALSGLTARPAIIGTQIGDEHDSDDDSDDSDDSDDDDDEDDSEDDDSEGDDGEHGDGEAVQGSDDSDSSDYNHESGSGEENVE